MFRIVLLLLWLVPALAVGQRLPFSAVVVSNPTITALYTDSAGFLWVGAQGGLFRFDGKHMDVVQPDDLGKNTEVTSLHEYRGSLIAGTAAGHLWFRNGADWLDLSGDMDLGAVHDLLSLRDTLWVASSSGLYFFRDDGLHKVEPHPEAKGLSVEKMVVDLEGRLLINALYGGFFTLEGVRMVRTLHERTKDYDLAFDEEGQLWSCGQKLLREYGTDSIREYYDREAGERNWINVLCMDGPGIWLGADGNGLYFFRRETGQLQHYSRENGFPARNVTSLVKDREGNLWIGTFGQGLYRLPTSALSLYGTESGFVDENLVSIQEVNEGAIWVGSYGGELYELSTEPDTRLGVRTYPAKRWRESVVRQGAVSPRLKLISRNQWMPSPGSTLWQATFNERGTWMGVNHSLSLLRPNGERMSWFRRLGLPSDVVYFVSTNGDTVTTAQEWGAAQLVGEEVVWMSKIDTIDYSTYTTIRFKEKQLFGSRAAGVLIKTEGGLQPFESCRAWSNFRISDFEKGPNGQLWIVSPEGGIGRFDGKQFVTRPFDFRVFSLAFLDEHVLLGTDRGVFVAAWTGDQDPEQLAFRPVDPTGNFGLLCKSQCILKQDGGRTAFIGTAEGLLVVDAERLQSTIASPQLYVRSLGLAGSDEELESFFDPNAKNFVLPARLNGINLEVGSIRLTGQDAVTYQYRIRNTARWSEPRTSSVIDLAELNSGSYDLEVRALINGVETGDVLSIPRIVILKPWYRTSLFLAVCGLFLIGLVVLIFVLRGRTLRRRNQILEERVDDRTREINRQKDELLEQYRQKEFLMKELHHRVKNNLQLMSSINRIQIRRTESEQVVTVLKDNQARLDSLALMHNHFYQNDILDNVQFDEYIDGLVAALLTLSGDTQVTLQKQLDPVRLSPDKTIALGLIINELISNALKHAFAGRASGILSLVLTANDSGLTIDLADDGVGLPAGDRKNFGLQVVNILVQQIDATLELKTDGGTHYRIAVPLTD